MTEITIVGADSDERRTRTDFVVPIANPVGDGDVSIAATVVVPRDGSTPTKFLVCTPGGSYSREYWHPSALDESFNFALAMSRRGFGVITLDPFGTGESEQPVDGDKLTLEVIADASHRALEALRVRLADGTLLDSLPPIPRAVYVAVGHSLGGAYVVVQQAKWSQFDAVALLGYTNVSVEGLYVPHENEESLTPAERRAWAVATVPQRGFGVRWEEMPMYLPPDRSPQKGRFFLGDVPETVIAAEESCTMTVIPRSAILEAVIPGVTAPYAAKIATPLFLSFGEVDLSPNPSDEPGTYPGADDITLFRLAGSAHCHNFAASRQRLWDRLGTWVETIARPAN